MAAKLILLFCAQAFFVQTAFSQCLGRGPVAAPTCGSSAAWGAGALGGAGLANLGLGASGLSSYGCAGNGLNGNGLAGNGLAIGIVPTSGGALPVSSASAIAPVGLSIASENVYEGALLAAGELPFVGTAGLEAVLPSGGVGVVNHACGSGVGIAAESISPAAYGNAGAYGLGGALGNGAAYGLGGALGNGATYGLGGALGNGAACGLGGALGNGAAYGLGAGSLGYGGRGCGCGRY